MQAFRGQPGARRVSHPPPSHEISRIKQTPETRWSQTDARKVRWDKGFDTDEALQKRWEGFHKANTPEPEHPEPGRATGVAKFGLEGLAEENAAMNRQRADEAIADLGPDPDPDHVRMVEEHYGLRTPQPQDTGRLDYGETRTIETGTSTLTISRAPKPDPETYDPFDPLGYEESIAGRRGRDHSRRRGRGG